MSATAFQRRRRKLAKQESFLPILKGYGVPINTEYPRSYAEYTKQEIVEMSAKEQKSFIEKYNLIIEGYKSMKAPELESALLIKLGLKVSESHV